MKSTVQGAFVSAYDATPQTCVTDTEMCMFVNVTESLVSTPTNICVLRSSRESELVAENKEIEFLDVGRDRVFRQFYVRSGVREQFSPFNHSRQSAI